MFVYLETVKDSKRFKCRGELGANDDIKGYGRIQTKGGLRVFTTPDFKGNEVLEGEDGKFKNQDDKAVAKAAVTFQDGS